MFPLSDNFKDKTGLCQLTAGFLNTVARMLNGLAIEMITGQDHAEIIAPNQHGDGWKFRIPSGAGGAPDTTGASKYQVYQITDDTTDPPTAGFDWVRAHA